MLLIIPNGKNRNKLKIPLIPSIGYNILELHDYKVMFVRHNSHTHTGHKGLTECEPQAVEYYFTVQLILTYLLMFKGTK